MLESRKTAKCSLSSWHTQLSQGRLVTIWYRRAVTAKKVETSVVTAVLEWPNGTVPLFTADYWPLRKTLLKTYEWDFQKQESTQFFHFKKNRVRIFEGDVVKFLRSVGQKKTIRWSCFMRVIIWFYFLILPERTAPKVFLWVGPRK